MFKRAKKYTITTESNFNSQDILMAFDIKGWHLYQSDARQNDLWYALSVGPTDNLSPSDESWRYYRIMPSIKERDNALKITISYNILAERNHLPRLQIPGKNGWREPLIIPARHIQFTPDHATFFSDINVPHSAFKVLYICFIPFFLHNFFPDLKHCIPYPYSYN
jgi:hypothetical protein